MYSLRSVKILRAQRGLGVWGLAPIKYKKQAFYTPFSITAPSNIIAKYNWKLASFLYSDPLREVYCSVGVTCFKNPPARDWLNDIPAVL